MINNDGYMKRTEIYLHKNRKLKKEQGKSEGFDSCDWPSNLNLYSNRQFFLPCDREI